jgi:hypothetical protein
MNFKTFEMLVKINTQDSQSKLPTTFNQWKTVIEQGIIKLEAETKEEIRTVDIFETDNDNIPLVEDIAIALVYHISQMYTSDINLKQKYILDYEDAKGTFLWNKFKEQELNK